MIRGVHHVAIKAQDVLRVSAFYTSVLDLPEVRRFEDDRGLRSVWLDCGGSIVMIERSDAGGATGTREATDPPGLHLLALRIERADREHWRHRLASTGNEIIAETAHTLYVNDPEGNRIGLCCLATSPA